MLTMFGPGTKSTERGQLTVRREDILKKLDEQRLQLVTAGVKSLALFGSLARDEAIDSSDVDLLVEFVRPTGLLGLIALKHALEKRLKLRKSICLLLRDSTRP